MEWVDLKQQTLKSVFYLDETDQPGYYIEKYGIHCIPSGAVLFELESGKWVLMENDIERSGLSVYDSEASLALGYKKIPLNSDKIWSGISNKTIKSIRLFTGHYLIGRPGKKQDLKKEITSSVELVFQHGESLFISNAEVNEKHELEDSLFCFILYRKRGLGVSHGFLPENDV